MQKIIVTSGGEYSDIDTLACGYAYKSMRGAFDIPTRLVLLGPLNESVSKTVKTWDYSFESTFNDNADDYSYVLVDISDPANFANFVIPEKIMEIYDHRWGFEDVWKHKLGTGANIEMVGACATLIWEKYKKAGIEKRIDVVSANLLYTAIFSNTLNFRAQITTQRDKDASVELAEFTKLLPNWVELYFDEIEESLVNNPINALTNDTKRTTINNIRYKIGQLELWDSTTFIETHSKVLQRWLADSTEAAFVSLPSISHGINYIFCLNKVTQEMLSKAIGVVFNGDIGITDKLWLRKEIMRELEQIK